MAMELLKMIIVDDEVFILNSLETLVDWQSIGVEVVGTADNGMLAIELAAQRRADIVLSDISMPNLSGIEMLEIIRNKQMLVEVIFISAHSNFNYAREAIRHGAFEYLLKPIREDVLLESVERCAKKIRDFREKTKSFTDAADQWVEEPNSGKHLVNSAISYIRSNYNKSISLSEVAEHISISPAYLSKIFSSEMQETFSQYLLSYRISRAKELLRSTHDKVYEVALHVGYNDTAHFSKIFKQYTGQTPNQYRNRM